MTTEPTLPPKPKKRWYNCWLCHTWGKWVDGTVTRSYREPPYSEEFKVDRSAQVRTCVHCARKKIKELCT